MATLAALRTLISGKLADGDLVDPTTTQIDAQINSTIEYYETDEFWFSEEIATLTATIGNPVLGSIPADFKEEILPNSLTVIENQLRTPLIKVTPLMYDLLNVEGLGLPRYYTFRKGQFELYNFPDQAYSIQLFYRKTFADLVNDGDSNDFTNKAARLIEYKTLADLLRDYRSDTTRAQLYDIRVNDEYNKIKEETYNRTATGMLTTENIVGGDINHFHGFY